MVYINCVEVNNMSNQNGRTVGVRLKINVMKIEKARLFAAQSGAKYLDATVFINIDEKDQYDNNGMITQDIPKEEKDAGTKGAILGNAQVFWSNMEAVSGGAPEPQSNEPMDYNEEDDDDTPF